jgi:leucyl aminopeptidase
MQSFISSRSRPQTALFVFCALLFSTSHWLPVSSVQAVETAKKMYITLGSDIWSDRDKAMENRFNFVQGDSNATILEVSELDLPRLSHLIHEKYNRCGGFMAHNSLEDAQETLAMFNQKDRKEIPVTYAINYVDTVKPLVAQVSESEIKATIEKLATYQNRFYQSATGVAAAQFIKERWEGLSSNFANRTAKLFPHSFKQPSVIVEIPGTEKPEEIVIVGGHLDSISGYFNREAARAPGADDNASGIATITEVIRILGEAKLKTKRTIMFMGYAGEELGLLGSNDIAKEFKRQGKKVVGVMQLDMTNFNGSSDDIVLMNDFTSVPQNEYITKLVDQYVGVKWSMDACGYACSDHASWTKNGYRASIPFEAHNKDMNVSEAAH